MDNDKLFVTVDKIVEKSKQWTLEGDCSLLQWMDQISKNLGERVVKTNFAINEMSTNLDRTSVALSNATNNLAALQYSQFVENRVHDDDETLANINEVPNMGTDVTDNQDANHNIYEFLKKNLEKMNSCHEAYSISYDDSDEDEPATNVVYRSKNPYEARCLPHIYGSNLWKEKWHIGLCDSDNDFSGDEESDQFSESSSTADESYESTAPTMSEWDSTAWGLNTSHLAERKGLHTPFNDGESSCQGDNYSQSEISTPRADQRNLPVVQPAQDQRYYQHVPKEGLFHDIFTDTEVGTKVATSSVQKVITQANLIVDEPPPDVEAVESDNNRRIGAKKPLNLFDDDEFSSFMDQVVQTSTNRGSKGKNITKEPTMSTVPSLFNDSKVVEQSAAKTNAKFRSESPKKTVAHNLFDDSETGNIRQPAEDNVRKEPQRKAVVPNLFDDSEDIFTPKVSQPSKARLKDVPPKLEDDIFLPAPLPVVNVNTRTRNLFDDDDDDDDFEKIFAAKTNASNTFTVKTKNLFDDDLEDSGTENAEKLPEVKQATVKEVPLLKKGLFDDEEDADLHIENDIFSRKPAKKIDLFEDLFNKVPKEDSMGKAASQKSDASALESEIASKQGQKCDSNQTEEQPVEQMSNPKTAIGPEAKPTTNKYLFADVFQDEPPDDIFASTSGKKKTKVADIFADNFADDFDEFIPKSEESKAEDDEAPVDYRTSEEQQTTSQDIIQMPSEEMKTKEIFADVFADDIDELLPKMTSKPKDISDRLTHTAEVNLSKTVPAIARKPTATTREKPEKEYKLAGTLSSSDKVKTDVADIFADDIADDFEQLSDSRAVTEKTADREEPALEDIFENRDESQQTIVQKLPEIARKPAVSKITQEKVKRVITEKSENPSVKIVQKAPVPTTLSTEVSPEVGNEPTTVAPSYTSLFHEEPPPDDDIASSYDEPPADDDALDAKSSAAAYNTINLFADVPPDDDFAIAPSLETKRIHSIFYDDFHETIEASREMRAPATYIFNEEPPPDDDGENLRVVPKPELTTVDEKKDRPKISKLKKMDLNINVGALLPTAKIPSFKKPEVSVSVSPKSYIKPCDEPNVKSTEKQDLPENILPNLNRDRAKVQVKRRPSTRKGRQESFRKSMLENNVVVDDQSDDDQKQTEGALKAAEFMEFDVEKIEIIPNVEEFQSRTTVKQQTPDITNKPETSGKGIQSVFEDSDTDAAKLRSSVTAPRSAAKIIDSLFDSVNIDEKPFGTPTKISEPPPESLSKTQPTAKAKPTSTVLFGDSDSDEEKSVLMTKKPSQPAFTSPDDPPKLSSNPATLFGESDDGSDDIFKEYKTPKKPSSQKTFEKKPKSKPIGQPVKPASSLFSSDEESGAADDIFGKPKTKAVPKKLETAKTKPSSSLFEDYSDDDDDLFGAAKKKPTGGDKSKSKPSIKKTLPSNEYAPAQQKPTAIGNNPLSDLLGA